MDNKQEFKWNDELVKEFADNVPVDEMANNTHIEQFKKSKEHKVEEKTKERVVVDVFGCSWVNHEAETLMITNLKGINTIPQEKFPEIKNLLERYLNGEMDNPAPSDNIPTLNRHTYENNEPSILNSPQEIKMEYGEIKKLPLTEQPKPRQMWNKHTGVHDESVLCTGMKCQEYNPLNKEHK